MILIDETYLLLQPTMHVFIHHNAMATNPLRPAPLESTPTPTAAQLHLRIPPAVNWNLWRILDNGVRHEQSLYGYFNVALNMIFPVQQQFQVKSLFYGKKSDTDTVICDWTDKSAVPWTPGCVSWQCPSWKEHIYWLYWIYKVSTLLTAGNTLFWHSYNQTMSNASITSMFGNGSHGWPKWCASL